MLFCSHTLQAQKFEIGPYIGGSNFIGDVGNTAYINPNSLAFGAVFRWNRSTRHAWRASIIHTALKANDANADEARRLQRGYDFSNGLTEITLGMEFTFWDWDIYDEHPGIVPYLFSGISGIFTHNYFVNSENELEKGNSKTTFAIPMTLGVKGRLSQHWVLALEIGARMTFSDNLDGSTPSEIKGGSDYHKFGNQNTNDWYMFSGIILTYTFGQNPCYDTY